MCQVWVSCCRHPMKRPPDYLKREGPNFPYQPESDIWMKPSWNLQTSRAILNAAVEHATWNRKHGPTEETFSNSSFIKPLPLVQKTDQEIVQYYMKISLNILYCGSNIDFAVSPQSRSTLPQDPAAVQSSPGLSPACVPSAGLLGTPGPDASREGVLPEAIIRQQFVAVSVAGSS